MGVSPASAAVAALESCQVATDTSFSDFNKGTATGAVITTASGGEISLPASNGSSFEGTSLPIGWTSTPWTDGSTASVANGVLTAESVGVSSVSKFASGSTLEFDANFSSGVYENAGFGAHFSNSDLAAFSTQDGGFWIYTNGNRTALPTSYLGSMHHYKIVWGAGAFTYLIDGVQVGIMAWTTTNPMDVGFLDQNLDGKKLVVDNATVTPYTGSGAFTSRVFNAGNSVAWGTIGYTASTPAGTEVAINVRTGNVSAPDSSWSAWRTVARGTPVNTTSQYIQYGLALASSDPLSLPVVSDVSIARPMNTSICTPGSVSDTSLADFTQGTFSGTTTGSVQDGEVMLKPTNGTSFAGTSLPTGWTEVPWSGSISLGDGTLVEEGSMVYSPTAFATTSTLEFDARFTSGGYQNAGFSNDLNSTATVGISTQTGGGLYLYAGGTKTALSASNVNKYINSWHRYKIVWSGASASFYADNTYLGYINYRATGPMKAAFGDQELDGSSFAVDNVAVTPYNGVGTFTSRVLDAGQVQTWSTVNWDAIVAGAAAMSVRVRTGNTANPDGTWTAWTSVTNGSTIGAASRYIQYQVTETSTDPLNLPVLQDITFNWALSFSPTFVRDTTTIDFYKGTLAGGTSINANYDGELTINGLPSTNFDGLANVPSGWTSSYATVAFDRLSVDGGNAATAAKYSPGTSVAFDANFGLALYQKAGFVSNIDSIYNAVFSTEYGDGLYIYANGQRIKILEHLSE